MRISDGSRRTDHVRVLRQESLQGWLPEYAIILKLRKDFPRPDHPAGSQEGSKNGLTCAQMEAFIALHRNAEELTALFEKVKKLSRVQPMPYRYAKIWFADRSPCFSGQPAFDADGFVIDPMTLNNMKDMVQEVTAANQNEAIPASSVKDTADNTA